MPRSLPFPSADGETLYSSSYMKAISPCKYICEVSLNTMLNTIALVNLKTVIPVKKAKRLKITHIHSFRLSIWHCLPLNLKETNIHKCITVGYGMGQSKLICHLKWQPLCHCPPKLACRHKPLSTTVSGSQHQAVHEWEHWLMWSENCLTFLAEGHSLKSCNVPYRKENQFFDRSSRHTTHPT